MIAEALVGGIHVAGVKFYRAVFLQSVIRHRGPAPRHHHRVVKKLARVMLHGIDKAVTSAQQEDNHEDAPCHGKAREGGAQLVAAGGGPYFV